MTIPHPTDADFPKAYSQAWSKDPEGLLRFFAPTGSYTDEAMGVTYEGHEGISTFHRFMLKFAPDSVIEFTDTFAVDGRLVSEWVWSGTCAGPIKLRDGSLVNLGGAHFDSPGVAVCTYGADGLLTSHRDFWDLATVLHQAGITIG